jgi:hypothetical protein
MRNRSAIQGYLSELIGKRKIEFEWRDRKALIEILHTPQSVYGLTKIFNEIDVVRLPPDDDDSDDNIPQGTRADRVFNWTSGPITRPATRKRIQKFVRYGLIEEIKDMKSIPKRMRFDFLKKRKNPQMRKKLYRVTEWGLFCYLLHGRPDIRAPDELPYLLVHYWESKVMRLLISSYFEKETVNRPTVLEYSVIKQFFAQRLSITNNGLSAIEEAEKDETWRQELIIQLEDDLVWHAKSFALRLLVDIGSKDKEKSQKSRLIWSFLANDNKFVKLAEDAVHEIRSYYIGGRLLGLDKALHKERH